MMKSKELINKGLQTDAPPASGFRSPVSALRSRIIFLSSKMIIRTGAIEEANYFHNLMYVAYSDPYCLLHFSKGVEYRIKIPLVTLLASIPEKPFIRCNRTTVINIFYFQVYDKKTHEVTLEDGAKFQLSKRNIALFRKKLEYMKDVSLPGPNCAGCDEQNCNDFRFFCLEPDVEKSEKTV